MEKRYQVFVSSTFVDLEDERKRIWQVLVDFGYIVAGMEAFPAADEEQFSFIQKQIAMSDYYILVLGGRYGSVLPCGKSFTESEFDYAIEQNIPAIVFPICDPRKVLVTKTDEDLEKARKLDAFRQKACQRRVVKMWSNSDDLCLGIIQALQNATMTKPRPGWIRGDRMATMTTIEDLVKIQKEYTTLEEKYNALKNDKKEFDKKQLSSWTEVEFSEKNGNGRTNRCRLSVRSILDELSITEDFDAETLREAVRGAISRNSDFDFDNIEMCEWQLDRVIVLLARLDIARIIEDDSRIFISRGPNFIPANLATKSKGWVHDPVHQENLEAKCSDES
jgi:hypothetical protein